MMKSQELPAQADSLTAQPDDKSTGEIRGPLRAQDREHCMAFAASLGVSRDVADAIIRCVAPKAYVNGFKDAQTGPASIAI